jgi:flagellar biogenesis protein FliO
MKHIFPLCLLLATSLFAQEPGKVFYPAAPAPVAAAPSAANPIVTTFLYLAFLGAMGYAAYVLWRRKAQPMRTVKATAPVIDITTTRPLGNRQFLVVVHYKGRELLLGVGPGFISKIDAEDKPCE